MQILFISNREHVQELFEHNFLGSDYQFCFSASEDSALVLLESNPISVIVIDLVYNLALPRPIIELAAFLTELPTIPRRLPVLLIGDGRPPCSSLREALELGAQDYVLLPESSETLMDSICALLEQGAQNDHLPFMIPAKAEAPPPKMGVRSITAARTTMELEKKLLDHLRDSPPPGSSSTDDPTGPDQGHSSLEHEIEDNDVMLTRQDPDPALTIPPIDAAVPENRNQLDDLAAELSEPADLLGSSSAPVVAYVDEIETLLSEGFLDLDEHDVPPFPERGATQELLNVVEAIEIPNTQAIVDDVMLDAALDDADQKINALQEKQAEGGSSDMVTQRHAESSSWEKREQQEAFAHETEKRIQEEMEAQAEFEMALHQEERQAREALQEKLVLEEETARKDLQSKLLEEEEKARLELESQLREQESEYKKEQEEKLRLHIESQRHQEEKKLAAHKERILEQLTIELQKEGEHQKKQEEEKFEEHKKRVLMEMASDLEQKEQEFLDKQKQAERTLQEELDKRIHQQKKRLQRREKKASDHLSKRLKEMEESALAEMKTSYAEKLSREEKRLQEVLEKKRLEAVKRIEAEHLKSQQRVQEQEQALAQRLAQEEEQARQNLEATIRKDWGKYQQQKDQLRAEQQSHQELIKQFQQQQDELRALQKSLQEAQHAQADEKASFEQERRAFQTERSQHRQRWSFKSGLFAHEESAGPQVESVISDAQPQATPEEDVGAPIVDQRPQKPEGGAWSLEELDQSIPPPGQPITAVPFSPLEGPFAEGELVALFFSAHQLQITGCLDIRHEDGRQRTIFFERGEPVAFASRQRTDRPEEFLFQQGLITHEKLLELQKGPAYSARRLCVQLVEDQALKATELFSSIRMILCNQVLSCLDFGAGHFLYREELSHLSDRVRLHEPFPELLLQGIRLKMHEETLWRLLGGPSAVVSARQDHARLPPFSAEETKVASLLNQPRSLEDLISSSGVEPVITLRVVYACLATNVINLLAKGLPQQNAPMTQTEQNIDLSRIRERLNMARQCNYYEFLGVSIDASAYEIRQAISRLRAMFHPDAYPDPAFLSIKDNLLEIQDILDEAELVLGDARTREQYARMTRLVQPQMGS